ncbi:ATPase, AAA family domain containing protein [Theileria equi strain WA]|uniref:ATPase, AAA family domain containing protein n=1 Tax=Theileria equi strain WA TaxID=1537102 RepID=L1LDM6_THEEQ|nr:ATPase, AAA family domain containing protein [Theileria equi strain WA]EKX73456.1 ATPase, AAA family domain containing protein [Theileria equi strain WA]|eukprot:XP_004832908.1 ATPase, AAA family domain containing protein [Theileria equi strain WA]
MENMHIRIIAAGYKQQIPVEYVLKGADMLRQEGYSKEGLHNADFKKAIMEFNNEIINDFEDRVLPKFDKLVDKFVAEFPAHLPKPKYTSIYEKLTQNSSSISHNKKLFINSFFDGDVHIGNIPLTTVSRRFDIKTKEERSNRITIQAQSTTPKGSPSTEKLPVKTKPKPQNPIAATPVNKNWGLLMRTNTNTPQTKPPLDLYSTNSHSSGSYRDTNVYSDNRYVDSRTEANTTNKNYKPFDSYNSLKPQENHTDYTQRSIDSTKSNGGRMGIMDMYENKLNNLKRPTNNTNPNNGISPNIAQQNGRTTSYPYGNYPKSFGTFPRQQNNSYTTKENENMNVNVDIERSTENVSGGHMIDDYKYHSNKKPAKRNWDKYITTESNLKVNNSATTTANNNSGNTTNINNVTSKRREVPENEDGKFKTGLDCLKKRCEEGKTTCDVDLEKVRTYGINFSNRATKNVTKKDSRYAIPEKYMPLTSGDVTEEMISLVLEMKLDECNNKVTENDIAGLENIKKIIKDKIVQPILRPHLHIGLFRAPKGILLFGPPGTGKTTIAKWIAHVSKATFFEISPSSITSKFHGETESIIKTLFKVAEFDSPSLIFIDEVDAVLGKRKSTEDDSSIRMKNQFLQMMDGLNNKADSIVIVAAATNRPDMLDDAALRRFTKRVLIPLPDFETRKSFIMDILNKNTSGKCQLAQEDLNTIASSTHGWSGSDLLGLCSKAAEYSYDDTIQEYGGIENIPNVDVFRSIVLSDFEKALGCVHPSSNWESFAFFQEWDQKFGSH